MRKSEASETPPETETRTPRCTVAGRLATFFITLAAALLLVVSTSGCSDDPPSATSAPASPTATSAPTPTSGSATEAGAGSNTLSASTTTAFVSPVQTTTENPERTVPAGTVPAGPLLTYEEPTLGFSITYPKGWKLTEAAGVAHTVGGDPIKNVGLFDPTGNHDGVVLLEGVAVSVFKLRVAVNPDLLTAFRDVVESQVSLLQAGLSQVEIIEGLRDSKIGETPALETTFRFTADGRRMRTRLVFVASGSLEYQLTAQASDASYAVSRPRLDQVIGGFRLKD